MNIDLKNKEIEIIQNKPYIIFRIKNFIDNDQYNYIKSNFPQPDFQKLPTQNKRYSLSSRNKNFFQEYFETNKSMIDLHDFFNSKKFILFCFNNFKYNFLIRAFKDLFLLSFSYRYLRNIHRFLYKDLIDLYKGCKFFFTKDKGIKTFLEYSYIFNEGSLGPHTDSRGKLLSLMLYFPEFNEGDKNFISELNTGTKFYSSNKINKSNTRLDEKDTEEFIQKYDINHQLKFEKYSLYGFMRCSKSWHNVNKINVSAEYVRRSINIDMVLK